MKLSPEMTARVLELAGGAAAKPKRNRAPSVVVAPVLPLWGVTLRPACRVVSEANQRGGWRAANARAKAQRKAVELAWVLSPLRRPEFARHQVVSLPCKVLLEHVGPEMDGDNLQRAFKAVRDELARLMGVDDGDPRVKWDYWQRTGEPGVRIVIEPGVRK